MRISMPHFSRVRNQAIALLCAGSVAFSGLSPAWASTPDLPYHSIFLGREYTKLTGGDRQSRLKPGLALLARLVNDGKAHVRPSDYRELDRKTAVYVLAAYSRDDLEDIISSVAKSTHTHPEQFITALWSSMTTDEREEATEDLPPILRDAWVKSSVIRWKPPAPPKKKPAAKPKPAQPTAKKAPPKPEPKPVEKSDNSTGSSVDADLLAIAVPVAVLGALAAGVYASREQLISLYRATPGLPPLPVVPGVIDAPPAAPKPPAPSVKAPAPKPPAPPVKAPAPKPPAPPVKAPAPKPPAPRVIYRDRVRVIEKPVYRTVPQRVAPAYVAPQRPAPAPVRHSAPAQPGVTTG